MRLVVQCLLGAALLAGTVPASAVPEPLTGLKSTIGERPTKKQRAAAEALISVDAVIMLEDSAYATEILGHIDTLLLLASANAEVSAGLATLRMMALASLGRADEAKAMARVTLATPSQADLRYSGPFAVALIVGDSGLALDVIEQASKSQMSLNGRSELSALFDLEAVADLNRQFIEKKDKISRSRLAEALVRLDWRPAGDPGPLDQFRRVAIDARLERGDLAGAGAIARDVGTEDALIPLLVTRKYDGLFAKDIDRGAAVAAAIARSDQRTQAALEAAPADRDALLQRAQFLRGVSREAEVPPLTMAFAQDLAVVEAAGTPGFWLVNETAYALQSIDRDKEAVDLMNRLLTLDMKAYPDLISMDINRGVILSNAGLYAESFAHAAKLSEQSTGFASRFGVMWMWSTAACALAAQGKVAEAKPWLDKLRGGSADNEAALMRALICADELDEAERFMIKRLADDDPDSLLVKLQDYRVDPTDNRDRFFGAVIEERWDAVRRRQAVKAAIDRIGRIVALPLSRDYWGAF